MKNLFCIYLLLFSIFVSSCGKDWLDQKPDRNLTVPSTIKDLELLMDDYATLHSCLSISEIANDTHYYPNNIWSSIITNEVINSFTWTNSKPYNNLTDWNGGYAAILNFNIVLEKLNEITPVTDGEAIKWKEIKGNALYHRARMFFELSQIFANSYSEGNSSKDLSIPLRTVSDINIKIRRSTISETYKTIIDDLRQAATLLPPIGLNKIRGSKCAVFAQLSRVYMAMGIYDQAHSFADSTLILNNYLQDFNKLSINAGNLGLFNEEVINFTTGSDYSALGRNYKVDTALYNMFSNDDLRKVIYLEKLSDGTIGFKGNHSNDSPPFYGLTTSEVLLNRAECFARENKPTEAMTDLNLLLKSRWKTGKFVDLVAISASQALDFVLRERKKELIRRGLRWMDLRRLNKEPRFAITITRTVGGQTYTLEPNSYKYTFPIPDDVIERSGMPQNPGWSR